MTGERKSDATPKGREAGRKLREAAAGEERKVEKQKGSDLKTGADRFAERAESAGGDVED